MYRYIFKESTDTQINIFTHMCSRYDISGVNDDSFDREFCVATKCVSISWNCDKVQTLSFHMIRFTTKYFNN